MQTKCSHQHINTTSTSCSSFKVHYSSKRISIVSEFKCCARSKNQKMLILMIISVLLVASISESIDSTSTTTPSSVFHIINLTSNSSADTDDDLRAFELFKYFVYPARHGVRDDHIENATFVNGTESVELNPENHRYDLEAMGSDLVDRQQRHYPASDPHHFYPNPVATGYGMSQNLMDPLFLMATLAFVTFLINSILGLVGRLNLPTVVRARNRWHDEMIMAERRDTMDAELLNEIEMALQIAFDEFEKYLDHKA